MRPADRAFSNRHPATLTPWSPRSSATPSPSPAGSPTWARAAASGSSVAPGGAIGSWTGRWSGPAFKTQLFRFVDVFPALTDDADVARHLSEYFDGVRRRPGLLDLGIDLADRVPLGARVEARIARRNIMRMARQFIVGATASDAVERPAPAVAGGQRLHGRRAGGEDRGRHRGRPVRRPGRRARRRARRRQPPLGPRRPPRARRPGPAAPCQREREAHGAGHALRAARRARRGWRRPRSACGRSCGWPASGAPS